MSTSAENLAHAKALEHAERDYKIWQVISASAAGTMIEWYDFYIFGVLGGVIAPLFYPPEAGETIALIMYLATFAVGFIVRPFGAVFFGRIGDLVGRKYAFLVTLLIMGGATASIGILPTYATIGVFAPILLLLIRVLQGLALGGEYGGAAIYVAEHVPDEDRGYFTSYIQTTASLGLFVALAVVLVVRLSMTAADLSNWGWRVPFLLSLLLVGMSLYIRLRMKESPIFKKLKEEGKTSDKPLTESLGNKRNWGLILLCLFGATAGQGVVWYTGQFYALYFIQNILMVDLKLAYPIIAVALLAALPLFVFFGWLSDRIGRKWIMMAGCLLAILTYYPIYRAMQSAAGSNVVKTGSASNEATGEVSLIPFTKIGETEAKVALVGEKVNYPLIGEITTAAPSVQVPDTNPDGSAKLTPEGKPRMKDVPAAVVNNQLVAFTKDSKTGNMAVNNQTIVNNALPDGTAVTIPQTAPPNFWLLTLLVFVQVLFVTMVYGPIAAFLVEFFPARVRYTSLSIPYHIGNGVFGGLLPLIGLYLCASTGNIYAGLLYPIIVAGITFLVGSLLLPETRQNRIWDELEAARSRGETA